MRALGWRFTIVAVLIFLCFGLNYFVSLKAVTLAERDAGFTHTTAHQQMLIEQVYLLFETPDFASPGRQAAFSESLDRFERNHIALMTFAEHTPALQAVYLASQSSAGPLSDQFLAEARLAQQGSEPTSKPDILGDSNRAALQAQLGTAMATLKTLSATRSDQFRRLQLASLVLGGLLLIIQVTFIVLPALKGARRIVRALSNECDRSNMSIDRLSHFASLSADLFWETDLEGRVTFVDGRFVSVFSGERTDVLGCSYLDLVQFDTKDQEALGDAISRLAPYSDVIGQFTAQDGHVYRLRMAGTPHFDEHGELFGYFGVAEDITTEWEAHESIVQLAYSDPLTNLANKRAFDDCLDRWSHEGSKDSCLGLIVLDMDGFKAVNDAYGHGAGDEALKIVANRLREVLREGDQAARLGGDEFAVVCQNVSSDGEVKQIADRLRRRLAEPYALTGVTVDMSASIGVAVATDSKVDIERLMADADAALYTAKRSGKRCVAHAPKIVPFAHERRIRSGPINLEGPKTDRLGA